LDLSGRSVLSGRSAQSDQLGYPDLVDPQGSWDSTQGDQERTQADLTGVPVASTAAQEQGEQEQGAQEQGEQEQDESLGQAALGCREEALEQDA